MYFKAHIIKSISEHLLIDKITYKYESKENACIAGYWSINRNCRMYE